MVAVEKTYKKAHFLVKALLSGLSLVAGFVVVFLLPSSEAPALGDLNANIAHADFGGVYIYNCGGGDSGPGCGSAGCGGCGCDSTGSGGS